MLEFLGVLNLCWRMHVISNNCGNTIHINHCILWRPEVIKYIPETRIWIRTGSKILAQVEVKIRRNGFRRRASAMHFSTRDLNVARTANGEFAKEIREAVKSGKSDKDRQRRDRRLLYKCGNGNRREATSRKIRLWRKMEQGFSKDKWCGVMCIHTNVLFSGYPQPIELQTSEIVSTTFNLTPLSGVIYFPFDPNSSVFYFITPNEGTDRSQYYSSPCQVICVYLV